MSSKNINHYQTELRNLLPDIKTKYHVASLALFGSYLHGQENEQSDLDVLVTFVKLPTLFSFVQLENYLSDELGIKVDLVMKDSLKPEIGKYILQEAQLI